MPSDELIISKHFLNGTEDGCIYLTEIIRNIIMYRIPRDFAQNLTSETCLKQAGVYLLMNRYARTLYVGQADSRDNGKGILGRMLEPHSQEVDQWDVGWAMMSGNSAFFGATELNWLEQHFYDKALEIGRYTLLNGNRPHAGSVTFSTKMMLNSYVDFAFFLLRVEMGCDAFEWPKEDAEAWFIDNTVRNVHAEGVSLPGNRFLVRKGSRVSETSNLLNQKGQARMEELRQQLIAEGVIKDFIFTRDYKFNSPSSAATVVLGTSSSGNREWKDAGCVSLGDRG